MTEQKQIQLSLENELYEVRHNLYHQIKKTVRYEMALNKIATDPKEDEEGDWSDTAEMFYGIAKEALERGKDENKA